MKFRRLLPRLVLGVLLFAAIVLATLYRDAIELATLDAWLGAPGRWAPIAFVILFALGTLAFLPGVLFALAGGALFGPLWGSLWNLAGPLAPRWHF